MWVYVFFIIYICKYLYIHAYFGTVANLIRQPATTEMLRILAIFTHFNSWNTQTFNVFNGTCLYVIRPVKKCRWQFIWMAFVISKWKPQNLWFYKENLLVIWKNIFSFYFLKLIKNVIWLGFGWSLCTLVCQRPRRSTWICIENNSLMILLRIAMKYSSEVNLISIDVLVK